MKGFIKNLNGVKMDCYFGKSNQTHITETVACQFRYHEPDFHAMFVLKKLKK